VRTHSLAHRARQRRLERASVTGHASINLVPLVDILTSIVFFSLLTYRGELLAELTAYDLALPPAVAAAAPAPADRPVPLDLVVRIEADSLVVQHAADGGFRRAVPGVRGAALDTLGALAAALRRAHPQEREARVTPADGVAYEDVVRVLERLRLAGFAELVLGAPGTASTVVPGA